MSSRSFTGQNGAIGWTATSWISAGSPVITTRFDFTSNNAFGAVRFFNHLDEDVIWRLLDWENALWEREKADNPGALCLTISAVGRHPCHGLTSRRGDTVDLSLPEVSLRTPVLLALYAGALFAAAAPAPKLSPIQFTDTRLANGLRVIIAEDHDAPVYSIAVTYNVGSLNERPGRTGFAHLFEHMMFKGSEKVGPGEHFFLVFNNGGNMNGSTNTDRTNYYETLPKNQLDLGLFLESDRMRSLAITKENLNNQRNAVQEERRLRVDNQPYGKSFERITELTYDNFAYKHSVIGSMEDLNAANVDDVKEFFRIYYAPNNATLVIVGDVDTKTALAKIDKYFGDIPKQDAPAAVDLSEPAHKEERREVIQDPLARLTRIAMAYRLPTGNAADTVAADVLSDIVCSGESSRLYQKLVKEKELAMSAGCYVEDRKGPSVFSIQAMVRPGKDPKEVEKVIDEEIARAAAEPVTDRELLRARSAARRAAVRSRESTLGRAVQISSDATIFNDPGRMNTMLDRAMAVTPEDMQRVAKTYLGTTNRVVVTTVPTERPKQSRGSDGAGQ